MTTVDTVVARAARQRAARRAAKARELLEAACEVLVERRVGAEFVDDPLEPRLMVPQTENAGRWHRVTVRTSSDRPWLVWAQGWLCPADRPQDLPAALRSAFGLGR